jgi:ribosomal-protein-alanine N-acetyltransferase
MPPMTRLPLADSLQGLIGPVEAVTARMFCARPSASAGPNYRRLFMDPAVELWLRPSPMEPFSPADIERLLRHDRSHWQIHGFGPWSLTDRDSGEFVGRAGLAWTRVEGREEVELPWAVIPSFHRQGLASEAALSAIETARKIGLAKVISLTLVENRASRGVMEKIGLEYVREVEHSNLPHALYKLDLKQDRA